MLFFGLVDNQTADYNTTITAPTAPTRTGYTFVGWYKDAEGTLAWNFATDKVTADTILYAKWSINSYTVTFDSQGGSAVADITANYNTTVAKPTAVPTRTGYVFAGWYKDAAGQTAWNFATDKVTDNVTIYAKWVANPTAPKAKAVSSAYNSITVSWAPVAGVSGYEISVATSKTGKYTVLATTTKTAYINTGLKTGTTYYYKVRSYKLINGVKVYSGYSTVVSAKPVPATPSTVKAVKASASAIKLTWSKVSGASYEIYRSTAKSGTYSLVKTTTNLTYANTGFIKGKTYYYKVRAYRMFGMTKVYSGWTTVVYVKL